MILARRLDLWLAAITSVLNVLVLLEVLELDEQGLAAINIAVGAVLALLANTDRPVPQAVLDVRNR